MATERSVVIFSQGTYGLPCTINESYHIENDYAYYLDMVKFETVPEYIVKAIDDYMERTYSKA